MGFWNKLGKIALQAAPYVAAPFTGGASLMATGATQKLGQKWAEHDAKKAIEKGLAPSKFDKYLGMASAGAGLASSFTGGFGLGSLGSKAGSAASTAGKAASAASTGSKAAKTASQLTGWQKNLATAGKVGSTLMGNAPMGAGTEGNAPEGWQGKLATGLGSVLAQRNATGSEPGVRPDAPINGFEQPSGAQARPVLNMPNLANSIMAGRNHALMSQPFRSGYQTRVQGPEEGQVITADMPPIYPNFTPPIQSPPIDESGGTPIQNAFADQLTPPQPRRARKRNPEEEEY